MVLQLLKISNFRQFYGKQILYFSTECEKNITVIHGENGSGKTALLNVFKWCLYGETDFDNNKQNSLFSERAISEANSGDELNLSIELEFEHDGSVYTAKRTATCQKNENGLDTGPIQTSFYLSVIKENGEYYEIENKDITISRILPKRLHTYFFFNGERIDKLAEPKADKEIKTAIKTIMGLEIMERAKDHLSIVLREFNRELNDLSGEDYKELSNKILNLEDRQDFLDKENGEKRLTIKQVNKEISLIESRLNAIHEVADLQKRREELEEEEKETFNIIEQTIKNQRESISSSGFTAFSESLFTEGLTLLEEQRKKGKIPSGIREQFINDLLSSGICICGRELKPDTPQYEKVKEQLNRSLSSTVEDASINLPPQLRQLLDDRKKLFQDLINHQEHLSQLESRKTKIREKFDEIKQKIDTSGNEDARKIECRLQDLKNQHDRINQELGSNNYERNINEKDLIKLREELKKHETKSEKARKKSLEVSYTREVSRVLRELYDSLTHKIREDLSHRVDETFRNIIKKDYWAEIDETFTLMIYKSIGGQKQPIYQKSTGENQITSLSFIASLISLCKEHSESKEYFQGGNYPLIMDSPFGTLDLGHRKLIAATIPSLSDQIIVMVSDSQWSDEIKREAAPRVGKEYFLIYNTPHPKHGQTSSLIRKTEGQEFTEIKDTLNE